MDYDKKWSRYRIRLTKDELKKNEQLLTEVFKMAYDYASA